jgi:hypothetical protein
MSCVRGNPTPDAQKMQPSCNRPLFTGVREGCTRELGGVLQTIHGRALI